MNIVTLDFETFFSADYTLSNMTTEEYVRDPRFEVHGCGVKMSDGETAQWYPAPQLIGQKPSDRGGLWDAIDWSNTAVLCHHAHFDGLILSHHYSIKPAFYLDTLSMARLLFGNHIKKSLEALAELFQLGAKQIPYDLFKGKHWHELTPQVQRQVADGCCQDVDLTWHLFQKLAASFPQTEYAFVDATVRMFTCPVLEGDVNLLAQIWSKEAATKAALLAKLGVTAVDLRKQWRFAELLRSEDIEPEQKPGKPAKCKTCGGSGAVDGDTACPECYGSGTTERWNYSFTKTDDFMRNLLKDETPLAVMPEATVAMLAQAKLDAHSTGTQTRVARMGFMSTRGPLCVYLNYAGTHLSGWSGGDKMNWQNFNRNGLLASAIQAPKGHKIVCADASQIECRLLNKIAGQDDMVERFRRHEDPYANVASAFHGFLVTKETHPVEREGGKRVELMSGYGAGGKKIAHTLRTFKLECTEEQGNGWRDAYRSTHPYVGNLWEQGNDVLKKLYAGMEFDWNVVHIKDKIIWLPNGVPLLYDTIEWHETEEKKGWRVRNRKGWSWLWGGMLVQQMMQALRSTVVRQAWQACIDAGLPIVSMEHDKLIGCVREHEADAAFAFMTQEMSRAPSWLPDIPLDSEGFISDTFAKPEK
jgi:DNA polymerase